MPKLNADAHRAAIHDAVQVLAANAPDRLLALADEVRAELAPAPTLIEELTAVAEAAPEAPAEPEAPKADDPAPEATAAPEEAPETPAEAPEAPADEKPKGSKKK